MQPLRVAERFAITGDRVELGPLSQRDKEEKAMYQTPELSKFGTFREITLQGKYGVLDGAARRNDGCTYDPSGRCS